MCALSPACPSTRGRKGWVVSHHMQWCRHKVDTHVVVVLSCNSLLPLSISNIFFLRWPIWGMLHGQYPTCAETRTLLPVLKQHSSYCLPLHTSCNTPTKMWVHIVYTTSAFSWNTQYVPFYKWPHPSLLFRNYYMCQVFTLFHSSVHLSKFNIHQLNTLHTLKWGSYVYTLTVSNPGTKWGRG